VLPLTLVAVVPLLVVGILVVQRLGGVNTERYEQEVVAARYAAELASENIRQSLRAEFRPWRERLVYSHMKGEERFERTLRDLYFTNPLLDVPQFVEEAVLRDLGTPVVPAGFGPGEHQCELLVAAILQERLVAEGRERMGYDAAKGKFRKTQLIVEDDEPVRDEPLQWVSVDIDGPLAEKCPGCVVQLEKIGARIDATHFALLAMIFPLPGANEMMPGMFGAIVPAPALLRGVIGPSIDRWAKGQDALPRHGLRLTDYAHTLVLPRTPPPDKSAAIALQHAEALYSTGLLGAGAPWNLEVVAISGLDASQIHGENVRWTAMLAVAALLLVLGALLFTRSFLHQVENTRLRSHLLSNVGHELKTPLSLIRLYTETLEAGRVRSDEERQKFLGIIGREASRLTRLIDNLLDVQRIEEDRKQYAFALVRPDRVVRDTVEAYRFQLTEDGFELRIDIDDDLPLLHIDEEALAQALINLLDNAAKYSVTHKEIRVGLKSRHEGVRISVQDRGIGIPAREQEKIFESFYRVEKGDVHDVKGSGLGLAVVSHVARAHGGRVEVDSTPGKGSTFTLDLPTDFYPEDS
jgi:signal transduction histidine kinase